LRAVWAGTCNTHFVYCSLKILTFLHLENMHSVLVSISKSSICCCSIFTAGYLTRRHFLSTQAPCWERCPRRYRCCIATSGGRRV
jgi:hypothetical protein